LQNQLVNKFSAALANIPQIPANVRSQVVNGIQSGGIGAGGVNVPAGVPATLKIQLVKLFQDSFAGALSNTMKVGIIALLLGTVVSLLIASHIRGRKDNNIPTA
jgi:ABC-type Fe3+ transport system permease subunit